jgi:hypothetical protein
MPIDPVKIPQNVYIEDRIVGPLTLRQIIIVAIGCGFSYAVWSSISKAYGFVAIPLIVLIWIPGILSIIFAFVRINDLSMMHICLLFLERLQKPAVRTWTPRRGLSLNIRTMSPQKQTSDSPIAAQSQPSKLDELSAVLDRKPTAQDSDDSKETEESEDVGVAQISLQSPATTRPVDPSRIKVTPLTTASLDDVRPVSAMPAFRDVSSITKPNGN